MLSVAHGSVVVKCCTKVAFISRRTFSERKPILHRSPLEGLRTSHFNTPKPYPSLPRKGQLGVHLAVHLGPWRSYTT